MNAFVAPPPPPTCPFCHVPEDAVVARSPHGIAVRDAFPVTEGHTLVLPRAHVASLYDLPLEERADLWTLVGEVRGALQDTLAPEGFTIGVNDGAAAGQTMPHAHVHVIPRREGDVPDPRGGIRWVVPERAAYWRKGAGAP